MLYLLIIDNFYILQYLYYHYVIELSGHISRIQKTPQSSSLTQFYTLSISLKINSWPKFNFGNVVAKNYIDRFDIFRPLSELFNKIFFWYFYDVYLTAKKEILHKVNGKFLSGNLISIMGPSGAGNSRLLNNFITKLNYNIEPSYF